MHVVSKQMATAIPSTRRALHTIRVGGVPEHFNTPWHTARDAGRFEDAGIALEWVSFPGGTGVMASALRAREIDAAVILTEGIVADQHRGSTAKLIGTYVSSPLTWGVHTGAASRVSSIENLFDERGTDGVTYAVSRMGSGSHLMAVIDVRQRFGDDAVRSLRFNVVGGFEGARAALKEGSADLFMWEKFTTKPFVDSGELRRVDECPTPWPCFMLAATSEAISAGAEHLQAMMQVVSTEAEKLRADGNAARTISEMYHLELSDVETWLSQTSWGAGDMAAISHGMLGQVTRTLAEVGVLETKLLRAPADLVAPTITSDARS